MIFSRLAPRLESSSQDSQCLSHNSHSSHPAQHVARALVVVSFTLEHNFTFHMHSNPTFDSTINQTFTDVIFTRGFTLRRSIDRPRVYHSFRENSDLAEEDNPVQVKPLFLHRPSMTSTYDSAESIATPPESDLDDE